MASFLTTGYAPMFRGLLDGHLADMSSPEVHVYLALHLLVDYQSGEADISSADLADVVNKSVRSISDILGSLQGKGYINRSFVGGRRTQHIAITKFKPASKATAARLERDRQAAIERTQDRINDMELVPEMSHETALKIAKFKAEKGWALPVDNSP